MYPYQPRQGISFAEWSNRISYEKPIMQAELDEWLFTGKPLLKQQPQSNIPYHTYSSHVYRNVSPTSEVETKLPLLQSPPQQQLRPSYGTHASVAGADDADFSSRAAEAANSAQAIAAHVRQRITQALPSQSTFVPIETSGEQRRTSGAQDSYRHVDTQVKGQNAMFDTDDGTDDSPPVVRSGSLEEFRDENGQPITSIASLKTALQILSNEPQESTPYSNEIILDNKRMVKRPVLNYLEQVNGRQKQILIREQKRLKQMQSLALALKKQRASVDRIRRPPASGKTMRASQSLPTLGQRGKSPRHLLRKLRTGKGKNSYAARRDLVKEYKTTQDRRKLLKTAKSVNILRLDDSVDEPMVLTGADTGPGMSYSMQYESMKRERELEISDLALRARQDRHAEYEQQQQRQHYQQPIRDYYGATVPQYLPLERMDDYGTHGTGNSPHGYHDHSAIPGVVPHDERKVNAENIIHARNQRLRLQQDILQEANSRLLDRSRQSEAKKRNLAQVMDFSQRSNQWTRFDSDLALLMRSNKLEMQNLDERGQYRLGKM